MEFNLVIVGPGRQRQDANEGARGVEFCVVEKLSLLDHCAISDAIDKIAEFDRSKDIARIVIYSFDRLMTTYRGSFLDEDEIGFDGFQASLLRLKCDLLNLSNSIYTFIQHQIVAIKRVFGKSSNELVVFDAAINSMEPYNAFMIALRHHFVHSDIRIDGFRKSTSGGVEFNPTVRIDELRKSGDRRSTENSHLACLSDELEVLPFIVEWRAHFDDLVDTTYDLRAKPAFRAAASLLERVKPFPLREKEAYALCETPNMSSLKGTANIKYRVIDSVTCEAIVSACC